MLFVGHLWVAPELLRDPNPPARGSAKGDVYSFGVILQECHTRRGPWSDVDLSCEGTNVHYTAIYMYTVRYST